MRFTNKKKRIQNIDTDDIMGLKQTLLHFKGSQAKRLGITVIHVSGQVKKRQ